MPTRPTAKVAVLLLGDWLRFSVVPLHVGGEHLKIRH
jgi:hypothetical protein